jgi:uncharacterized membrane protein YhhN
VAEEPTPRQVLYGLVAAGFHLVVAILAVASARLGPAWWNWSVAVVWVVGAVVIASRWRRIGTALTVAVGVFLMWAVGAVVVLG